MSFSSGTSSVLLSAINGTQTTSSSISRNIIKHASLSCHLNPYDEPGYNSNHRIGVLHTLTGGYDGEGIYVPQRNNDFTPTEKNALLGKKPFNNVSITYGPFSGAFNKKMLHLWTDQVAFVQYGVNPLTATANCYAFMPFTVYPFFVDGTDVYSFAIIRDTVNGNVYIGVADGD